MSFHVGQKVICIKRGPWKRCINGELLVIALPNFGDVYTVTKVDICRERVFLGLQEFPAYKTFLVDHFRHIIERKTDISVFTAMLTPSPTKREPVA